MSLEQQVSILPTQSGVYLFKDEIGRVIYVGKAVNLRQRVRSYFNASRNLGFKTHQMVSRARDLEFFVTDFEQEAFLLECNLIKKYRPRYNVRLKDGKTYPYLKINICDTWPRMLVTRRFQNDGSKYFGPFASAKSVRQTLSLLRNLFPVRSCNQSITEKLERPCLEYHLHRCVGPCIGAVTPEAYREIIKQVILFLEGKQEEVVQQLRESMEQSAANLEFERAALLRDRICAVESVIERQKVVSADGEFDAVAMAQARSQAYMQVFFVRNGKLMGREYFIMEGTQDEELSHIMSSFVSQFYEAAPDVPPLILLQHNIDDMQVVQKWLESRRGGPVTLQVPCRGKKKQFVDMVAENARQGLEMLRTKLLSEPDVITKALEEIQQQLCLPRLPERMECYDISNIQGTSAVGSMVVFDNGLPLKAHYRRFKIRTVVGADDYAMLHEVLTRRFSKNLEGTWAIMPDLVLIDGGKGQLGAALQAMQSIGMHAVPVASIAKEREEIFLPGVADPILMPRSSGALQLLQRMRDEAHRFAIGYYQKVHKKVSFSSALDDISGIGPKRKRALLREFGSLKAIKEASEEDIAAVNGMSEAIAKKIKDSL